MPIPGAGVPMLLGFALTEHCNLRCPHCIRDDVTTIRSLDGGLIESVLDQAIALYGSVVVRLPGGEPLLPPESARLVQLFADRRVPYRFVSNGWHVKRLMPLFDRCPPQAVRLSLSGATEQVHDAERGRGSFRRVLLAVALMTSRRISTALSIVVDGRDRQQLRQAADLADAPRSYVGRLRGLRAAQRPPVGGSGGVFDTLPCIRCARASGKLEWLKAYPASPWHQASFAPTITRFVRPSLRGAR